MNYSLCWAAGQHEQCCTVMSHDKFDNNVITKYVQLCSIRGSIVNTVINVGLSPLNSKLKLTHGPRGFNIFTELPRLENVNVEMLSVASCV